MARSPSDRGSLRDKRIDPGKRMGRDGKHKNTESGSGTRTRRESEARKPSKEANNSPAKGRRSIFRNIFKKRSAPKGQQNTSVNNGDLAMKRKDGPTRGDHRSRASSPSRQSSRRTNDNILRLAVGGEFIGTFVHVLLGLGIECLCRVVSTDSTLSEDYLPKLGWGLSWTAAFCVAGGISGGHFNGTVSFALFLAGYISILTMLLYWLAQALAALMAGLVIYALYYWPLDRRFGLDDTNHLFVGSAFGGAVRENVAAPFFWSIAASFLCAFVLVLTVFFITDQKNMHVPRPMYGLLIGLLCYTPVLLITSFFYYGCAVINFPVDPVTRIYTLFSWKNDYLNAIGGWIGCFIGAVFACIIDLAIHRYDSLRPRKPNAPVGGPRRSESTINNVNT